MGFFDFIPIELRAIYNGNGIDRGMSELAKAMKKASKETLGLDKSMKGASGAFGEGTIKGGVLVGALAAVALGIVKVSEAAAELKRRDLRFDSIFNSVTGDAGTAKKKVSDLALTYRQSAQTIEQAVLRLGESTGDYAAAINEVDLVYKLAAKSGLEFAESQTVIAAAIKGNREEIARLLPQLDGLLTDTDALDVIRQFTEGAGPGKSDGLFASMKDLGSAVKDKAAFILAFTPMAESARLWEDLLRSGANSVRGGEAGGETEATDPVSLLEKLIEMRKAAAKAEREEKRKEREAAKREREAEDLAARRAESKRRLLGDVSGFDPFYYGGDRARAEERRRRSTRTGLAYGDVRPRGDFQGGHGRLRRLDETKKDKKRYEEAEKRHKLIREGMREDVQLMEEMAAGVESMFVNAFGAAIDGGNALKSILNDIRDNAVKSLGVEIANALAPMIGSAIGGPFGGILAGALTGGGFSSGAAAGVSAARQTGLAWRSARG